MLGQALAAAAAAQRPASLARQAVVLVRPAARLAAGVALLAVVGVVVAVRAAGTHGNARSL